MASKTYVWPSDSGSLRKRLSITALGLGKGWILGSSTRGRGPVYLGNLAMICCDKRVPDAKGWGIHIVNFET